MNKTNTPKFERYYIRKSDKLIFEDLRRQLARMLGRPIVQADFAGLIAKYGEQIRDLIAEQEKTE